MSEILPLYEKLGAFYLGNEYDLKQRARCDDLVLYDSKDLVTHAVIVGMTGSGKTGLGVALLEEAAIDGIPALIVDPKGDLSNLKLQFPQLQASDFKPWVHPDEASRAGVSVDEYAQQQADLWKRGLESWGQDGARIERLGQSVDTTIYTPGSDAGTPVSILASFGAPPESVRNNGDLFRDQISATATSLLSLLGIDADPIRSREHILLTNLFHNVWNMGDDLDLGSIIQLVQSPPFERVGVMDLESFFPEKDRFAFAMTLNNLLATPAFSQWLTGAPLDIQQMLYGLDGKPRHAIFSIAHLSDSERMFFMSLLLNQVLGWMRSRSGTTSLRALLYIDEIFGYMPPIQEPPSKKPLLTLLKQARAFGLGVVLATQNPVDLDYKGLSNTGTWFLGRLQTERDKQRVLDGLQGATNESGGRFDRGKIADLLSNLDKRVFLMHNVHEERPVLFQTRWVLSYLTGPMTRQQIRQLTDAHETIPVPHEPSNQQTSEPISAASPPPPAEQVAEARRPLVPPGIRELFLTPKPTAERGEMTYQPQLLADVKVHFVDSRRRLSAERDEMLLVPAPLANEQMDWDAAQRLTVLPSRWKSEPVVDATFAEVPPGLLDESRLKAWTKDLDDYLYHTATFALFRSPSLDVYSEPGESEAEFRIRLREQAREERDRQIEKLRQKYANRIRTMEDRVQRAEHAVDREMQEANAEKMETAISFGTSILNAVLGRKSRRGSASAASRSISRISKQSDDVRRAEEKLAKYRGQLVDVEHELADEIDQICQQIDPLREQFELFQLRPRRTDIDIRRLALAWIPTIRDSAGQIAWLV